MSGGATGGITIEEEMRRSYLDYAMSVIVARALPDVRDGLKPVHRRILYAMKELGYDWNRPYRKSARIVGDVMGKYHPHGDSAIYDAMVRMAQDFSMRLPLVDGQGNFGSMDGDPPAAMRYTEARLQRVASEALLEDIDRDTVDFQVNYDESTSEPTVVPARFPNLLVNGAGGIAVGMATNIPPHNLGEVIDACCALVDDPEASDETLMQLVPGPDFPTGGLILGRSGIGSAYRTGRGSVLMRARTHIEELPREREAIIVTEVPYQVNKARMLERIAEVVREKIVEGISEIRDESDRHGLRVVIELRRDAVSDVILNQLYRYTPLQTSFGVNMLAIDSGRPRMMTLREVIVAFVRFREEVIARRTAYELNKARERAHVLVGLAIAVANIDEVIALIRHAPDPDTARAGLLGRSWPAGDVGPLVDLIDEPGHQVAEDGTYRLSEAQAKAILELRLQRLTGLERDKIAGELESLAAKIREYLAILGSRERLMEVLRGELVDIKERFGTPRRTSIEDSEFEHDIEDLIPREDMVVTVTHGGYIKRVPLSTYRAQRRGGRGRAGMAMRDEDFVSSLFVCDTHTPVLFFSSRGMVYKLKVWRLPLGTPQARGKALVNILPLQDGESITAWMALPEDESTWGEMDVMFATSAGTVRRNRLSDFTNVMANGKIAMKLEAADGHLVAVRTCSPADDVLLATGGGKTIRFRVDDVRVFAGRSSVGVRGIRLAAGDRVISMSILRHIEAAPEERVAYLRWAAAQRRAENGTGNDNGDGEGEGLAEEAAGEVELSAERLAELQAAEEFLLSVSDDGFGKRTSAYEYRVTGRGGQGIGNLDLSRSGGRSARVSAVFPVGPGDQIMLVTDAGQLIRTGVEDIRIAGRTTRGVTLFRVAEGERVVSVAHMADLDTEEDEDGEPSEEAGETPAAPEDEGSEAPRASDAPDDDAPDDEGPENGT
ncbi:DNA gyrase subunit A [Aquibaculum arenosum]|uniref:DNA gyrase subunit A n=1 Tax=Aquibaculum arenosum TaxID=3032591 RepID=A0ABT5YMD9_9PROT|nr:DNA gyrase subunit A [Fodinicurvata sp. CAU 1616]MDF2095996.1 DNA gyrase subunit A [Fodinicurvata sp. CAU 1616]